MDLQLLLDQASIVHACIQFTLQANTEENYCDGLIPPPEITSLQDCEIPDSVDDPLQIVRHVRGEARARWLEYEDDLESIAQEIEGGGISVETRKERNRLSAKHSRDAKNAYILELESHLRQAQERNVVLEQELVVMASKFSALQQEAMHNPMYFLSDMA